MTMRHCLHCLKSYDEPGWSDGVTPARDVYGEDGFCSPDCIGYSL